MSTRRTRQEIEDLEDEEESAASSGYLLVTLSRAARTIPGKPGGTKIFHESDADHPNNGEALVTGDAVVKVYPTIGVRKAIASGLLVDVTGRKGETPVGPNLADLLDQGVINPFTQTPPAPAADAPTLTGASAPTVADGEGETPRRRR